MSIFASQHKQKIVIEEVEFTIRKLSHKSLREARAVKSLEITRNSKEAGGELIKAFRDMADRPNEPKPKPTAAEMKRERLAQFDPSDLLVRGVESWSLTEELKLDDLTEPVAQQLFEAIVELSLGPVEPAAVEEGKG
jgi:hypothetical protein